MGKSYMNSAIERAPTLETIEQGMRNSGGARNLSLVAKNSASVANPGTYPSSTRDSTGARQGAGTSLVQNLNQIMSQGQSGHAHSQKRADTQPNQHPTP